MKTTFFIDYSGTDDFSVPIKRNLDLFNCLDSVALCFNLSHLREDIENVLKDLKNILNKNTEVFVCFYLPGPGEFKPIHARRLSRIILLCDLHANFAGFILNAENFVKYNFVRTPKDVLDYNETIEVILNASQETRAFPKYCVTVTSKTSESVSGKVNFDRCEKIIPMLYDTTGNIDAKFYGHSMVHGHSKSNWIALREHQMGSFKHFDLHVERVFVWSFLNLLK